MRSDSMQEDSFGFFIKRLGAPKNEQERYNGFTLDSDWMGDMTFSKPSTVVMGLPGSTYYESNVTVEDSTIINGAIILCADGEDGVTISAAGKLVLINCIIKRAAGTQVASECYIRVASGGLLVASGCIFEGAQTAGNIITNAGAGTKAMVSGCVNATGLGGASYVNVTTATEVL